MTTASRFDHLIKATAKFIRRQHIEPLFGFVDFKCIRADVARPWYTRERNPGIDSRTGGNTDIDLLSENLSKEGIIEPLHVLYEGEVPEERWEDKASLSREVSSWKPFTLALGFRRYDAIKKALEKGLLKEPLKVPVRIYLPEEIRKKTGESVEHYLTKAAVSSNVFFKGYTTADKLRITRTLIRQLKAAEKPATHRSILHLLGIKKSESSAEHQASLRRFYVCSNDAIYFALTGFDAEGKHDPQKQVLTQSLAEHLANRLGRNQALVDRFLKELSSEITALRDKPQNALLKDEPSTRLNGYDFSTYRRWIDNLKVHGNSRKELLAPSAFNYDVKSHRSQISIPSIRCDLDDSSPEGVAKIVEVAYKLEKVATALKAHLERIAPEDSGCEVTPLDRPTAPTICHDATYKVFLHGLHLERYANTGAIRNLDKLDSNIEAWALPKDVVEERKKAAGKVPLGACPSTQTGKPPSNPSLQEPNLGELVVNEFVIHKFIDEGKKIAGECHREEVALQANSKTVDEVAKILPLMAGSFSAYSRSLSSLPALRDACGKLKDVVFKVARSNGHAKGLKLGDLEKKVDQAMSRFQSCAPDRQAERDVRRALDGLLARSRNGSNGGSARPADPKKKHHREPDRTMKRAAGPRDSKKKLRPRVKVRKTTPSITRSKKKRCARSRH